MHIRFNVAPSTGKEIDNIKEVIATGRICGDGDFTKRCQEWIEKETGAKRALLTTSCTQALEMAALMAGIEPGDEVIMPSYTFVSTANAFVLRGAKIVFVDIRPDTLNIDEKLIEGAITEKTKAIVPVHYGGVACEMDTIMDIAKRYGLIVIEDAAQGVMASYRGRALGTIGDYGCFSFHETKNYSMGEGGAILINHEEDVERAEIIREKGTDRTKFLQGKVDKYSWVSVGSSYLPSDLNAAYLLPQLLIADEIKKDRKESRRRYEEELRPLKDKGYFDYQEVPEECDENGHLFSIRVKDNKERGDLIRFLGENDIYAVFHYVPLHSSEAGKKYGRFFGEDVYTTKESERLIRLPMYYGLTDEARETVIDAVYEFYKEERDD